MKYVNALRDGIRNRLQSEPRSLLIGEDILDPYGGAFKVSKGLSTELPDKILQTPISESGFVGVATGLAYCGYHPIVEIMFGDFLTIIADAVINSASKFPWLSQDRIQGTVTIRTPVGGGRGYGPIHSQSLEKIFFGWPGVSVIAANTLVDPGELFAAAHQDKSPVKIFLEHKLDYPRSLITDEELTEKGFLRSVTESPFPVATIANQDLDGDPDITICCYGGSVHSVLDAAYSVFIEEEITTKIVVPSLIFPVSTREIAKSVSGSRNLLIVEEGYTPSGWGASVVAALTRESGCSVPSSSISIVGPKFEPIPADREREQLHFPTAQSITAEIEKLSRVA